MLFERVSKPDSQGGYLLDGFPRTIPQAKALEQHLANNVKLVVLNLDVKDELIIKRIAGRQSCQQCGNVHNQHFSAPSEAGKCDKCKGALVQRTDDSPEVVKERLRVYHEQTKPLVHYYQEKGILYTVDGEQPPDIVFNSLIKAFN